MSCKFSLGSTYSVIITGKAGILNLGEVQLYNAGVQIPSNQLKFYLSSDWGWGEYTVANCNDGNLVTFCSTTFDWRPTLTITSTLLMDKVFVQNRIGNTARIVGATIVWKKGNEEIYSSTFESEQNSYTFIGECHMNISVVVIAWHMRR